MPPPLVVPFTLGLVSFTPPLVVPLARPLVSFTPPLVVPGWPRNTPQAILLIVSSGVSTPTHEPTVPAYEIKQVKS